MAVGLDVGALELQFARLFVALALHDAGRQLVVAQLQPRVSPRAYSSQHAAHASLAKLRAGHVAVYLIFIRMRATVGVAHVPHPRLLVASQAQRVAVESVVRLVLRVQLCPRLSLWQGGGTVHQQHTRHRVAAIHQRGRAFQNFHLVHPLSVYLNAVFVAPLLSFLSHPVAHGHDAVVAQPPDDGLRDAAARRHLGQSGLAGNGIDNVGGAQRVQFALRHDADGSRRILHLRLSRQALHHHLAHVKVAEEHVGRVFGRILCRRGHAAAQPHEHCKMSFHIV